MFKIVLIEDDKFQRAIIIQTLKSLFPCEVKDFEFASEGLGVIKDFKPNLVISDICMPEMDGIAFVRSFAKVCCDIPLLLISSVKEDILDSVHIMAREYGIKAVSSAQKPLSKDSLLVAIAEYASGYQRSQKDLPAHHLSRDFLLTQLARHNFVPHVQPQFNVDGTEVVAAEVLVRWNHPSKGIISPALFLDAFEEHGIMPDLTYAMLNSSLKWLKEWQQVKPKLELSVNVSPPELTEVKFAENLISLLEYYEIKPDSLTIEITETSTYTQIAQALETINRLRINGVKISMDDFGTGYANIQHLIESPFTELKIDMSYTQKMLKNQRHCAVVETALTLAKKLGIQAVAEGVNSAEVARKLSELGCDRLQGFHLGRPVQPEAFTELLSA